MTTCGIPIIRHRMCAWRRSVTTVRARLSTMHPRDTRSLASRRRSRFRSRRPVWRARSQRSRRMRIVSSSPSQSTGCTPPGTGRDEDSLSVRASQTTSCDAVAGRGNGAERECTVGSQQRPTPQARRREIEADAVARDDRQMLVARKQRSRPFRARTATGSESSAGAGRCGDRGTRSRSVHEAPGEPSTGRPGFRRRESEWCRAARVARRSDSR